MKGLGVGALILVLALPSYARTAELEGMIGGRMPSAEGAAPAAGRPPPGAAGARSAMEGRGGVRRFSETLQKLKPDARAATRGTREAEVYRSASRSVVLVLTDQGLGSGVLVSADGQIVTNFHVVDGAKIVGVVFKPEQEGAEISRADVVKAQVLKKDEVSDLALLKVEAVPQGVAPLALGGVASLQVGADVHAIGHPDGESWTYTRGIVSQIRRDYAWVTESGIEHQATVIQTQTPINPGNSGGPLINDALQVVGINSFVTDGEGLNFAVSADDVSAFIARSGDRLAQRARARQAAGKACEPKVMKEWRENDPPAVHELLDIDCDGKADAEFMTPDDEKEPALILLDANNDGEIDMLMADLDRDGDPDEALYDTDGDNKADMRAFFRNGEWEPYRWEVFEAASDDSGKNRRQ